MTTKTPRNDAALDVPSDTARLNMVLDTFGKREDNMPLTPAERGLIVAFTDRGSYTKGMKLSAIDDAVRAAPLSAIPLTETVRKGDADTNGVALGEGAKHG